MKTMEEHLANNIQLFSKEAEESVIGSILLEGSLVKDCVLTSEHFHIIELKRIFWSMKRLDEKNQPIDIVSVTNLVKKDMDKVGGVSYLGELAGSVPSTSIFKFYESLVIQYWKKRKSLEIANSFIAQVMEEDSDEAVQGVIDELMKIEDEDSSEDTGDI